jgi:hypothetical protein
MATIRPEPIRAAQLAEGNEVHLAADAVGGISHDSHHGVFEPMIAAGAQPITAPVFGTELLRNLARGDSGNLRKIINPYLPRQHEPDQAGK